MPAILFLAAGAAARQGCILALAPEALQESHAAFVEYGRAVKGQRTSYHTDLLPRISVNEITDQTNLKGQGLGYGGGNNSGLIKGKIKGREVFIKFCSLVRSGNGMSEASFAKLMSDLHLGPHFYGIAMRGSQPVGIVTDFVDGEAVKHQDLTGKLRRTSDTIKNFLFEIGILTRGDLQYRIGKNGRFWIVDTGLFMSFHQGLKAENFDAELIRTLRN